jgi:hypothetical protein
LEFAALPAGIVVGSSGTGCLALSAHYDGWNKYGDRDLDGRIPGLARILTKQTIRREATSRK